MKCKKNCTKCKIMQNSYKGKGKTCPIIYENFYWYKKKSND